ncbi:MAG TPA: 3-deoxy-7-phosphoheptulonate synthase [Thermotogales bacterium]|nr:3-deoxy-7-phosphoheptulonate synthase [Thermotogales bacterium]
MIVLLKAGSGDREIEKVVEVAKKFDLGYHISRGVERTIIGIIGDDRYLAIESFEALECVEKVVRILKPYKLVAKEFKAEDTTVDVGGIPIGNGYFTIIAGPCSIEGREMILETADFLSSLGVKILRGGAFKPRTSPYSFQGLGVKGLEYMREAADKYGMKIVSEALGQDTLDVVEEYVDMVQIGARNSQNFNLLKEVGEREKPILLKRGFMNTVEELLQSAEYIALQGNMNIVLCERGIRTFETSTRNTLDISAVPVIKSQSHLPVIVDPSHASGRRDLIIPLSKAAMAVGANGIMVEVHPRPEKALSDGKQSLNFKEFEELMKTVKSLAKVMGVNLV